MCGASGPRTFAAMANERLTLELSRAIRKEAPMRKIRKQKRARTPVSIVRKVAAVFAIAALLTVPATPALGKGKATKASLTAVGCDFTVKASWWNQRFVDQIRTYVFADDDIAEIIDVRSGGFRSPYSVTVTGPFFRADPIVWSATVELYNDTTLVGNVPTNTLTSNCALSPF